MAKIATGSSRVPAFSVINKAITYKFDKTKQHYQPVIGGEAPLFGKVLNEQEAEQLVDLGKKPYRQKIALIATPYSVMAPTMPRI